MTKRYFFTDRAAQYTVEIPFLLLTGGVLYWTIELLFRGWSHWTMILCGALCFLTIYKINERYPAVSILRRAFLDATLITLLEFAVGCILNLWLGWHVWDYSNLPFHLLGQICLPFFFLWFLLCILADLLCKWIRRHIFCDNA